MGDGRHRRPGGSGDVERVAWAPTTCWSTRLHAASPVPPMAESPYLPVTKRFANAMYLRIEDVPEYAYLDEDDRGRIRRWPLAAPDDTGRRNCWSATRYGRPRREALEILHTAARTPGGRPASTRTTHRRCSGLSIGGPGAFSASSTARTGTTGPNRCAIRTEEVAAFREQHATGSTSTAGSSGSSTSSLDTAQSAAERAGMRAGIVHDLAVGVHGDGADSWCLQDR